jgi:hypothetical protein
VEGPGTSGVLPNRTTRAVPDLDTLIRGYLATGWLRQAVSGLGEETVAELMRTAFARHTGAEGSVSRTDEYRLLIARA